MALVRCSCVADVETTSDGPRLRVVVPDPTCGYVVHRLAADRWDGSAVDDVPRR